MGARQTTLQYKMSSEEDFRFLSLFLFTSCANVEGLTTIINSAEDGCLPASHARNFRAPSVSPQTCQRPHCYEHHFRSSSPVINKNRTLLNSLQRPWIFLSRLASNDREPIICARRKRPLHCKFTLFDLPLSEKQK